MNAKDFPALLGPLKMSLCPRRRTPVISSGARSGGFSANSEPLSNGGSLSSNSSRHFSHSAHEAQPEPATTMYCRLPLRSTPGRRDRRDGLRFWLSTSKPFNFNTLYRSLTRRLYRSMSFPASIFTTAWRLFPPEWMMKVAGTCNSRRMASCRSTGIPSDSTRACRYSTTFASAQPFPSIGFNRHQAPASGSRLEFRAASSGLPPSSASSISTAFRE